MVCSRAFVLLIVVLLLMGANCGAGLAGGSISGPAATSSASATTVSPPTYVSGEALVKFKGDCSAGARAAAAREAGAVLNRVGHPENKDTLLLSLDPKTSVEEAVRRLRHSKEVVFAEPNFLGQLLYTPSDPDFPQQWGLRNTGQEIGGVTGIPGADIDATRAWDLEQGNTNPVTVAVFDSGINAAHPDLESKIWTNTAEVPGNSIDDDGNGYVDDANGYNWAGISQRTYTYFSGGTWQTMYKELGTGVDAQGFAQSIVGTGCELTHIGVMLSKENSPANNITVSLKTDLGGPDVGSFTISPSELTDSPTEIYKPLSSGMNLQPGATYFIVVETTVADPTNHFLLYDYQTSKTGWFGYWDGLEYKWDGSSWAVDEGDDLYFRTNPSSRPADDNSHGTQVSGIVSAEHNDQGIAGVSRGAKIMPLKVTDSSGVYTIADLCDALHYAADNGARIVNMSLGGPLSYAVQDAVNYAHSKGVVLFAAAGNNGDGTIWYPAGYQNVVGVGATTNRDEKASFSNYNSSVDVTAPGKDVYTTDRFGGYFATWGTSFASPHGAGLAALVLSAKPSYTSLQVEQAIEQHANDLGAPGRDDYFGYGRIDAYATIKGVLTPRIDTLDPSRGPTNSEVAITGDSFGNPQGESYVTFGSSRAAIKSWANDKIVCTVPEGLSGTVPVTVTNNIGTSAAAHFQVIPKIDSLDPSRGPTNSEVAITGDSFGNPQGESYVTFGSSRAAIKSWANDKIICTVPEGLSGTVPVTVTNNIGTSAAADFRVNPRIDSLDPSRGPTNSEVAITGDSFGNPQGESYVTFGSSRAAIKSWANDKIVCTVPEGLSGTVPVTVTNNIGTSAAAHFQVTCPIWYLAEGSTAWGFETTINIENPNDSNLNARVTFMLSDGTSKVRVIALPKMSQTTINPKDDVGERDFSTRVECLEGRNIAVDRTVRWSSHHGNDTGEHNSIGVTSPAKTWYLPEGSSTWGFECWLLLQNPNAGEANCQITYMIEGKPPYAVTRAIKPHSRATFSMADDIGPADASIKIKSDLPIIPERSMYTHWVSPETGTVVRREGHDSIGATTPATDYYLAEGSTAFGFATYLLVQNPNMTPASVTLTYMTNSGAIDDKPFTMPPESRRTVRLNDSHPGLDLSTKVHSDKPIIAERSMYWASPYVPESGVGMHDSIGTDAPHATWYLPGGGVWSENRGTETYTLVQNPNGSDIKVRITYLKPAGKGNVTFTDAVPARSRKTFNMADKLSETSAAIMVECLNKGKEIIVERSMYSCGRWGGTNTIGGYAP